MSWSIDIVRFKNTYTCIELDSDGIPIPGVDMTVIRFNKNMWIFDIADGHVLEIYVSPTTPSEGAVNYIIECPTYVKDDLTYQIFRSDIDRSLCCQFSFGRITSIRRGGKYNAISCFAFSEHNSRESSPPVIFVVPCLHSHDIPALIQTSDCDAPEPWAPNSSHAQSEPIIIKEDDYDFVLDEITPCGRSSAHKMTSDIWSQEICPPAHFHDFFVAPRNLLRIVIKNRSNVNIEFAVTPLFITMFKYDETRISVNPGENKIINIFAPDPILEGYKVQRMHLDTNLRVTNLFRVYNECYGVASIMPLPVAIPFDVPTAVDDADVAYIQNMVQNLQITKQNLRTLQCNQKTILDRLLQT